MSRKELIIESFRKLATVMLELVLNDDYSYEYMSKHNFIRTLREFFDLLKSDEANTALTAVSGFGHVNAVKKKGYAFLNIYDERVMSLVFEEIEDDYNAIYYSKDFESVTGPIAEGWYDITFYLDDRLDFIPTARERREIELCRRAVQEIEREINEEGILSKGFYIPWLETYGHLSTLADAILRSSYRYKKKVARYVQMIRYWAEAIRNGDTYRNLWEEFIAIPVVSKDSVMKWFERCSEYPVVLQEFRYETNLRQGFLVDNGVKINLTEHYYLHSIASIKTSYAAWYREYKNFSYRGLY